jgi:hypothetical protein
LIDHESIILETSDGSGSLPLHQFPQWPCLRANTEKIFDAIENGELQHGRDGKAVQVGDHVAKGRITVRHTDLKAWMARCYPDQKPVFLFDEIERTSHTAINADAFRALQADRDALKARLDNAEKWWKENSAKLTALESELTKMKSPTAGLATTERNTLLSIIAALCSHAKLDYRRPAKTAPLIKNYATEMGLSIGETTIEGHLKKIPDALEARMK